MRIVRGEIHCVELRFFRGVLYLPWCENVTRDVSCSGVWFDSWYFPSSHQTGAKAGAEMGVASFIFRPLLSPMMLCNRVPLTVCEGFYSGAAHRRSPFECLHLRCFLMPGTKSYPSLVSSLCDAGSWNTHSAHRLCLTFTIDEVMLRSRVHRVKWPERRAGKWLRLWICCRRSGPWDAVLRCVSNIYDSRQLHSHSPSGGGSSEAVSWLRLKWALKEFRSSGDEGSTVLQRPAVVWIVSRWFGAESPLSSDPRIFRPWWGSFKLPGKMGVLQNIDWTLQHGK